MKVSMNGLRRNLSSDVDTLKDIVMAILKKEWYDSDCLLEAMNSVIQDSNILNCVFNEGDDSFKDMSYLAVDQIDLSEDSNDWDIDLAN